MALVGGLGTITGPIVGAFIIITMQNYLASFGEFVPGDPGRDLRRDRDGLPQGTGRRGSPTGGRRAARRADLARADRRGLLAGIAAVGGVRHQAILELARIAQLVDQHDAGDHQHRHDTEHDQLFWRVRRPRAPLRWAPDIPPDPTGFGSWLTCSIGGPRAGIGRRVGCVRDGGGGSRPSAAGVCRLPSARSGRDRDR